MQEVVHPLVQEFLYDLPDGLIARYPVEPYDSCRLMVMDLEKKTTSDSEFFKLHEFLEPGDLLVVNDTRVEKRRVFLRRKSLNNTPGARLETIFLNPSGDKNYWEVLIKKRQRLNDGEILFSEVNPEFTFKVHKNEGGKLRLECPDAMTHEVFDKIGQMPIPPYLKREEEDIDQDAYQNPFFHQGGSVAAPTASLHFTDSLKEKLNEKGISILPVTLNVGYGTFAPLKEENFSSNKLHDEEYLISEETAGILGEKKYNKIYAVGTTVLRVLESVYVETNGKYDSHLKGMTNLFCHPPYKIQSVDGLITNFHLPGSSLMMLVACLTGKEELLAAYEKAIEKKYRFFSYGDAMLIRR